MEASWRLNCDRANSSQDDILSLVLFNVLFSPCLSDQDDKGFHLQWESYVRYQILSNPKVWRSEILFRFLLDKLPGATSQSNHISCCPILKPYLCRFEAIGPAQSSDIIWRHVTSDLSGLPLTPGLRSWRYIRCFQNHRSFPSHVAVTESRSVLNLKAFSARLAGLTWFNILNILVTRFFV